MSWPCGVLTCRASYAFHVGEQYRLWTETLTFSQIRNFSLTCCLSTMVKRHSKATGVAFLFGTGARMKTLIQGTLGRLPFNNFSLISKLTLKSSRFGLVFFNGGNGRYKFLKPCFRRHVFLTMVMIFYRHFQKWHISYDLGRGGGGNTACFNWKEGGCFPFITQTFTNHGCPRSDHVSGTLLFSLISLDMNTADLDCFDSFSNGWVSAPKTANNFK